MVGDGGLGKSPAMEAALFRRQDGERWAPIDITTDATLEAILWLSGLMPRTVFCILQTHSRGLFQALNKYRNGKGNDRESLEVLWGGSGSDLENDAGIWEAWP